MSLLDHITTEHPVFAEGKVIAKRCYSRHTILELVGEQGRFELYASRGGIEGLIIEGETWKLELNQQGHVVAGRMVTQPC